MAIVLVTPSLGSEFFGGKEEMGVEASNIFQLVAALDRISPGFGAIAEARVAFAVDGTLTADWSTPLSETSEVLLVPRVAGG